MRPSGKDHVIFLLMFAFVLGMLPAQTTNGTISGVAKDETGADRRSVGHGRPDSGHDDNVAASAVCVEDPILGPAGVIRLAKSENGRQYA